MRPRAALAVLLALAASPAHAESDKIRLSHGYGTPYLPLMVVRDRQLLEKHAASAGLGKVAVEWQVLDGGNIINDAMLAGTLDAGGTGVPGFITLWAKARGLPRQEIIGISAVSSSSLWLNTNNPAVKSLRDFTEKDRIAVPGIKTSFAAVALQMAAAKEFGPENFARLDPLTVGLPHPDAYAALVGGKTEITAHFASPPFSYQELKHPHIRRVVSTLDVIGPLTGIVVFGAKRFADANPGLMRALIDAEDEADALIAENHAEAAEAFLRHSKLSVPRADLEALLADPENRFSTTPEGVMHYAEFMAKAGLVKTKPASWRELFIAALHDRSGS